MSDLLKSIRSRNSRTGVITADRYLRSIEQCFNGGFCPTEVVKCASRDQWSKAIEEAESKLCYTDDDMRVDTKSIAKGEDGVSGIIMKFDAIITTTKVDRDGDIMLTAGATVDTDMPLLWQHTPFQPIGKLVRVIEHTDSLLGARFIVADIPLGRDASVLIEMGALRISHGFDPIEFEPRKDEDEGWLFQKFNIYEVSVVSIPSNIDAVITAFSRDKLHTPMVKAWAQKFYDERPVQGKGLDLHVSIGDRPQASKWNALVDCIENTRDAVAVMATGKSGNKLMERILQLKAAKKKSACACGTLDAAWETCGMPGEPGLELAVTATGKAAFNLLSLLESARPSCTCQNKSFHVPYEPVAAIEDANRAFDAGAALQRLKDWAKGDGEKFQLADESHRNLYQKAFTFVRINGDEFGNYELLHHDIVDGKLVTFPKAVRDMIAKVNGAFGGIGESSEDRKAMYDHLAQHLKDFGETPPLFKKNAESEKNRDALQESTISKDGRTLSEKNAGIVKEAVGDLKIALRGELSDPVRGLLESAVSRLSGLLNQERSFASIRREYFAELIGQSVDVVDNDITCCFAIIEGMAQELESKAAAEQELEDGQLLELLGVI